MQQSCIRLRGPAPLSQRGTPLLSPELKLGVLRGGGDKSKQAHIECFTGSERGASSQCPVCGHKHKPKGRNWACRKCGFTDHRDTVGCVNMHKIAFAQHVSFPRSVTYLRPGLSRSSSRADTPLASPDACCLSQPTDQPLRLARVPTGTGHTFGVR